ncbi:MAG: competence/damage-inducible protein A [Desulfococcaceae bacterium]
MIAEILSTGDEIRSGALADTNAAWLAQKLEETGIDVSRHNCVGDDMSMLINVFREIGARADVVLVTGGLGPTTDDLSAGAAGKAANVPLVLNQKAFDSISEFFASRNWIMTESNRKQAMLPQGSEMLDNPVGTAPGFTLKIGKCQFFFMPGVPFEMKKMFADQVMPRIEKLRGDDRASHQTRTISTFGLGESRVGEMMAELPSLFPAIRLGLRAKFPEIQIKLYGSHKSGAELERQLIAAQAWVVEKMGEKIFSTTGESMEAVVGSMLRKRKAGLALAESCTGGLIASRITDVSGSSDYFLFSAVTYSNEAKIIVLGVKPETLERYGAVSEECVREMAAGVQRMTNATYGLAVSGIAGPGGGSDEKPVGTVCFGLAGPGGVKSFRFVMKYATRAMQKSMFAMKAVDLLRQELR